eukprot:6892396-Prymnesium_polylepis.1
MGAQCGAVAVRRRCVCVGSVLVLAAACPPLFIYRVGQNKNCIRRGFVGRCPAFPRFFLQCVKTRINGVNSPRGTRLCVHTPRSP